MAACGLMLLVGVVLSYRWRSYYLAQPDWATRDLRTSSEGVDRPWLRLLWLISVGVLTGFTVGALVVGPGGRLVMRLLAATSPESKGFRTEAQETVGRITFSGTVGFIIFVGLAFGVAAGLTYVFVYFALTFGPANDKKPGTLISEGIANFVGACEDEAVPKLVFESGLMTTDGEGLSFVARAAVGLFPSLNRKFTTTRSSPKRQSGAATSPG